MKIHFKKSKNTKNPKKTKGTNLNNFLYQISVVVVVFVVLSSVYGLVDKNRKEIKDSSINDIVNAIKNQEVENIEVTGNEIKANLKNETILKTSKESDSSLTQTLINYGVLSEEISNTPIIIKNPTGFRLFLLSVIPFLIPIIVIGFIIYILTKQVKGAGMQAFNFGQSKARIIYPNDTKNLITFNDVAGSREAKQELKEIVEFLKEPKKFFDIGAQIPKGVLLTGHPGTGKTLLARAVAGEAQVPFFHLSGSEFVEMFVGVGASRVRDLFKMAKKLAPAIIFIDEIDAVGRSRGVGMGGGNDEREQTLNQILVEMDGFEPTDRVIVMAATNRSDVLDNALLRPGRFDRRVVLDLPDRRDRLEILKIHSRKKKIKEGVNLDVIASRTPGFSGADLYSVMNEAAILSARNNLKELDQKSLTDAIEKVMIGPERQSHLMGEKEKNLTAYHEAGHAVLASLLEHAAPEQKFSIISRGNAGGYTLKIPLEDKRLHTKKSFLDDITITLGGYVTEEMILGDVTTGPSSDIEVATKIARQMVTKFGMNDHLGPVLMDGQSKKFNSGFGGETEISEKTIEKIDLEIQNIINNCYLKAKELLTQNRNILDAVADKLIAEETLEQDAYNEIISSFGIVPKT